MKFGVGVKYGNEMSQLRCTRCGKINLVPRYGIELGKMECECGWKTFRLVNSRKIRKLNGNTQVQAAI